MIFNKNFHLFTSEPTVCVPVIISRGAFVGKKKLHKLSRLCVTAIFTGQNMAGSCMFAFVCQRVFVMAEPNEENNKKLELQNSCRRRMACLHFLRSIHKTIIIKPLSFVVLKPTTAAAT